MRCHVKTAAMKDEDSHCLPARFWHGMRYSNLSFQGVERNEMLVRRDYIGNCYICRKRTFMYHGSTCICRECYPRAKRTFDKVAACLMDLAGVDEDRSLPGIKRYGS